MKEQERADLLVRAAWYYHKLELTQKEVGEKLGLSRQKVQRLLQEAKDKGIIKVQIENPKVNLLRIEEEMKARYSLSDVVIAPCPSSGDKLRDSLGRVASTHIKKLIGNQDVDVLGTGWGKTLRSFVDHFQPGFNREDMDVVSLIGNLLTDTAVNPYEIANTLARKLSANCYNIWAPSIVEKKSSAEIFRTEEWIKETLEKAEAADLLIVGLGPVSERATLYDLGYISEEDLEALRAQGAVGDILGRYFDEKGELVDLGLHERVIASSFEQIRDGQGDVIVVGGGDFKLDAMKGALNGDLVDILITDERLAQKLV